MSGKIINPPMWGRALARAANQLAEGELVLRFANGAERSISAAKSGARAVLELTNARVLPRMIFKGTVGLAESYLDGDWSSPDLAAVFEFGARNFDRMAGSLRGLGALRLLNHSRHRARANTREGSKRNIAAHYDLGNAFYSAWLDPTMSYSSAVFDSETTDLESAQRAKWRRIAEMLDLHAGMHILEIGCGWGGFAIYAAREFSCHVTAITLSLEQYAHVTSEVSRLGLSDFIDVRIQDYRDVRESFDRIVSIEMFEAVGEENWPVFFEAVRERLRPGGIAALQIITIEDAYFASYRSSADFIQLYIFPGGMLPTPKILQTIAMHQGLGFETVRTFALSYAETLKRWRERFQSRWPEIAAQGFDERFKRMWEYYLAYCEGGFRAGTIDVGQFRLTKA